MLLKIAQLGQPVLRQVARAIPPDQILSPEFQEFLRDMEETLQQQCGVGLAAPQVFASDRVFLAAILPPETEEGLPNVEVFINPSLTTLTEEKTQAWEGCLSFPELLVLVPRFLAVRIDYLNAMGQAVSRELQGFPARVIQHEFDHLEGILTIDRAESSRDIIKASEIEAVMQHQGMPDV